jgi:hypothetical protein
MEKFWGLVFIMGIIIYYVCKWCADQEERQKEENFKRTHPREYAQLKQMEHEREMMVHDEKRMRHQNVQTGARLVSSFFRGFWG